MLKGRMPEPIRLFVVDDHALFREGLLRLLETDARLAVAGSADSIASTLERLPAAKADILILDFDLGDDNAVMLVRELKQRGIVMRILIVTAGLPNRDAVELIQMGVSGIFHKRNPPEELHQSILQVAEGKVLIEQQYLQSVVASAAGAAPTQLRLSSRDQATLRLVLEGCSNKEIAQRTKLSESAVKASLQSLFAQAGVRTRAQLVRFALEELGGGV
jgi:two-component system nitrate/nitrite response regulator NarL